MTHSKILLNDGISAVLGNTGDYIILNAEGEVHGAEGTTRVKKKVGRQLVNDDLGTRPVYHASGEMKAKVVHTFQSGSVSKIKAYYKHKSEAFVVPHFGGASKAKLYVRAFSESYGKLKYIVLTVRGESWGTLHPSYGMQKVYKEMESMKDYAKYTTYINLIKAVDEMDVETISETMPVISGIESATTRSFEFKEETKDEKLIAFTHSSSFIGNVRYNTETQELRILLNGKPYTFCGVPLRS